MISISWKRINKRWDLDETRLFDWQMFNKLKKKILENIFFYEFIFFQPPDHQLASIGAFVVPTVLILHNIHRPLKEVMDVAEKFYR